MTPPNRKPGYVQLTIKNPDNPTELRRIPMGGAFMYAGCRYFVAVPPRQPGIQLPSPDPESHGDWPVFAVNAEGMACAWISCKQLVLPITAEIIFER